MVNKYNIHSSEQKGDMRMTEIVMAAFRVDKSNSVHYQVYRTMKGFLRAIERVIEEKEPDYISIRVIRDCQKSETK